MCLCDALGSCCVYNDAFCVCVCVQIVGNGSEQQLQRELEDVLMDPSVADVTPGSDQVDRVDQGYPTTAAPPQPCPALQKLEIVLPVQGAKQGMRSLYICFLNRETRTEAMPTYTIL